MQTDLDLESRSRSTAHDRNHRMFLSFISNQGLSAAMQAACSNISGNALMQISVVVVVKLCLYLAIAIALCFYGVAPNIEHDDHSYNTAFFLSQRVRKTGFRLRHWILVTFSLHLSKSPFLALALIIVPTKCKHHRKVRVRDVN